MTAVKCISRMCDCGCGEISSITGNGTLQAAFYDDKIEFQFQGGKLFDRLWTLLFMKLFFRRGIKGKLVGVELVNGQRFEVSPVGLVVVAAHGFVTGSPCQWKELLPAVSAQETQG